MNDTSITALIPAAGRVPESVLALSNVSCPAMIPVAGRPVAQWTLGYLRDLGVDRATMAVAERGLFVEEFVDCVFGTDLEVDFVVPPTDRGLGGTIASLVETVSGGGALVVLGDTHFQLADPADLHGDDIVVLVDEVEESYRWCVAEIDDQGFVKGLRDKEPDLPGPLRALIGVYWFPDTEVLRQAATLALREIDGPVQMADILERVGSDQPIRAVSAGQWLDCGNPDRQAAAQRVLLEQRAFNELHVDEVFGTITKRSHHVDKFRNEINYLRSLPADLAVLFPRVLEHSLEPADTHVTLEFYGYPTLAELFVYENVDAGIWHRVFEHLHELITRGFMAHPHTVDPAHVRAMYVDKARDRLQALDGPPELRRLIDADGPITVNGVELAPLNALWPRLEAEVDAIGATSVGGVIHGDLCFSNVLYDLRSGVCKLIDPRGSFGPTGIYGDVRYDIAKLWHSLHGHYDFITADLFRVNVDGLAVDLDIRTRPHHDRVRSSFGEVFFPAFDARDITLITGLIFASLPALHYDHPQRQLALFARGLQLVDEALQMPSTSKPD